MVIARCSTMRKNLDYKWMLVQFREEDLQQSLMNIQFDAELRNWYHKILLEGVLSRRNSSQAFSYHYFGPSGSQMRSEKFWFLAVAENLRSDIAAEKIHQVRTELGDLKSIRNVATYVTRVGLYLTTSKSADVSKDTVVCLNQETNYPNRFSSHFTIPLNCIVRVDIFAQSYSSHGDDGACSSRSIRNITHISSKILKQTHTVLRMVLV